MFDMGKTDKIALTPEQERWLVAHFRHTTNPEIARRLGISETTMHRFARELGLTKSRQHMRKTQRNAADRARESHLRNGTYPPKGYIIPRSEEFRFKPGETSAQRIGKARERKRIERAAESRRKTFREEKARALFEGAEGEDLPEVVPQEPGLHPGRARAYRLLDAGDTAGHGPGEKAEAVVPVSSA